jgi:glucose-6-phosphate 1-dehydrogenase
VLLYLRFANAMLDSLWDGDHAACVQITMAEQFGLDDRGGFYEAVGALRDVVVNHLLQLLAATFAGAEDARRAAAEVREHAGSASGTEAESRPRAGWIVRFAPGVA